MSITKPFTFVAGTKARANEVNADFDELYSQVNKNISNISQNALDIDNLDSNKANINGNSTEVFNVADATANTHSVNKQTLFKYIENTLDYITGLTISKDSGSPNDTIIVTAGSCYDSTKSVVLVLANSTSKKNENQAANATYYIHIIGNATGSSTDILISTSQLSPTLPVGYTLFRYVGSYTTNSSGNINVITNISDSSKLSSTQRLSGGSGYCRLSNGLLIQWGWVDGMGNGTTRKVTLPTAYTTGYIVVGSSGYEQTRGDKGSTWRAYDTTNLTWFTLQSHFEQWSASIMWLAIGT